MDPTSDQVTLDGKLLKNAPPPRVYWLLNKPSGYITSRKDDQNRPTIYDLPRLKGTSFHVAAVGRLDLKTEGLLILTNDGDLSHRLTHPSYKLPRSYHVLVNKALTPEEARQLKDGIRLEDGPVKGVKLRPIKGQQLGASKGKWYEITVYEGRNRLVRRLMEHFDCKVLRLVRFKFGDLGLPTTLDPGEYQQLSSSQIKMLKDAVGLT